MTITPEQLAKLPKWARAEMERLNREVSRLEAHIEESAAMMRPAHDDSAAMYWGSDNTWHDLPATRVRLRDRSGWVEMSTERPNPSSAGGVLVRVSYEMQVDMRVGNTILVRDMHGYQLPEATV